MNNYETQSEWQESKPATEEEFLNSLKPYIQQALEGNLELVLHVFTDRKDVWTQDTSKAFERYINWVERFDAARLYIELYTDRENEEMEFEDCLLSHGDFPM